MLWKGSSIEEWEDRIEKQTKRKSQFTGPLLSWFSSKATVLSSTGEALDICEEGIRKYSSCCMEKDSRFCLSSPSDMSLISSLRVPVLFYK